MPAAPFNQRLALSPDLENNEIYPKLNIMHFARQSFVCFLRNQNLLDIVEGCHGSGDHMSLIHSFAPNCPTV